MRQHTSTFTAYTEAGDPVTLHVYTTYRSVPTRASPNAVAPGLREILTDDGKAVNRIEKGNYQMVATGTVLHSEDADAP